MQAALSASSRSPRQPGATAICSALLALAVPCGVNPSPAACHRSLCVNWGASSSLGVFPSRGTGLVTVKVGQTAQTPLLSSMGATEPRVDRISRLVGRVESSSNCLPCCQPGVFLVLMNQVMGLESQDSHPVGTRDPRAGRGQEELRGPEGP